MERCCKLSHFCFTCLFFIEIFILQSALLPNFRVEISFSISQNPTFAVSFVQRSCITNWETHSDFQIDRYCFQGLSIVFNRAQNQIYAAYQTSPNDTTSVQFMSASVAMGNFLTTTGTTPKIILIDVVNDLLSVSIVGEGNLLTNVSLPGFATMMALTERSFGISASNNETSYVDIHSINYFEIDPMPESTTTELVTTTFAANSTTISSIQETTMVPTTIEMAVATSYYSEVTGNFSIDGNMTLPDGTVLTSDPWPEVLNNPNSPEFASLKQVMAPGLVFLYESTGLYSQVSVNITGFRYGSIISDYVVALRSLTSLTAEQIKEKVKEKVAQLGSSMLQGTPGFQSATVKNVDVSSVKIISRPLTSSSSTTKPPNLAANSGANSSVVGAKYCQFHFVWLLMLIFSISFL